MDTATCWSSAVADTLEGDTDNTCSIAKGLTDGKLNLHQFVTCLGKYLSDPDNYLRAKGCKLLVDVLHKIPNEYVTSEEASHLVIFLCDRLQDNDLVVTQALHGLVAMSTATNLSNNDALKILGELFKEISPNNITRMLNDRRNVYLILQNMLQQHLEAVKTMNSDFVSGFIQSIDGEKDPRNLVLIFNLVPVVTSNFEIDAFAEEFYEVIGCYFPIDYSPPADNPDAVPAEQLVVGLRKCFASTPKFAQYCVPLILEKIDSDIQSAKIDALLTLTECACVYGSENLCSFYVDAWKSIRREVSSNRSPSVESAAFSALTALVKSSCSSVVFRDSKDTFTNLLDDILSDCLSSMCQPATTLIHQSAKLLQAAAVASYTACQRVINAVVPMLLERYLVSRTEVHQLVVLLGVLNGFLDICGQFATNDFNPLQAFESALLRLYTEICNDTTDETVKQAGVRGLLTMALSSHLNNQEISACAELIARIAIDDCNGNVRQSSLDAMSRLAQTRPQAVKETLLPHLTEVVKSITDNEVYKNHLDLLCAITVELESMSVVTSALLADFGLLLSSGGDVEKMCNILECFAGMVRRTRVTMASSYAEVLLQPILALSYKNWFRIGSTDNEMLLQSLLPIFRCAVPHLSTEESVDVLLATLKPSLHGRIVDHLANSDLQLSDAKSIVFVDCVLSCCRREALAETPKLPRSVIDALFAAILAYMDDNKCGDVTFLSCLRCLASILNKLPNETHLEELVQTVLERFSSSRWKSNYVDDKRNELLVLAWLTKATTMRGHRSMDTFIAKLFSYLDDADVCERVADGFQFILSNVSEALCVECHANSLLFYKQRLFLTTYKRLLQEIQEGKDPRHCYLKSLILQLPLIPKESYASELQTLLPVLLKGMTCNQRDILIPLLDTLHDILQDNVQLLDIRADVFIVHLLKLSSFKGAMKVRVRALNILERLVALPTHVTVRQKQDVVRELAPALDDPKRLVRRAAVLARNQWFLVGSPGGGR